MSKDYVFPHNPQTPAFSFLSNSTPLVSAASYGVVGDGTTDDTAATNAAFAAAAAAGSAVDFGNMIVKLTGAVTCGGAGFRFNSCSYGNAGDMGFLVTGTGYTAVTIAGSPTVLHGTAYGTGNTANLFYFNNPLLAQATKLRAYNANGFGIKIDKAWDCTFLDLSIELCGNASNYAFSINDAGDTSNMSHIGRLQVERATTKAIFVSGSSLSCLIDNIHSEQAVATAGVDTWYLGGSRSQYSAGRFSATVGANATLHLQPGDSHYYSFLTEGAIKVLVDSGTGTAVNSFNGFEIQGTLDIGYQANYDPMYFQFNNCNIANVTNSSTHSAACFTNCTISGTSNGSAGHLSNVCTLVNCDVTPTTTLVRSGGGILKVIGSVIRGSITYSNASPMRFDCSQVTGTVASGDGGNHDCLLDSQSTVGSSSSGITAAPTGGAHVRGDTHWHPLPVAATTPGWVCTTAGTPGTWKAMAVLAA